MAAHLFTRTYSELDSQGYFGNETEYAIEALRNTVAALYPDNSRDLPTIQNVEAQIAEFERVSSEYVRALRILVATNPA